MVQWLLENLWVSPESKSDWRQNEFEHLLQCKYTTQQSAQQRSTCLQTFKSEQSIYRKRREPLCLWLWLVHQVCVFFWRRSTTSQQQRAFFFQPRTESASQHIWDSRFSAPVPKPNSYKRATATTTAPHSSPHTLLQCQFKNALKLLDCVTPPPTGWRARPLSLPNICLHHFPTGYSQSSDCERINRANPSYPYLAVGSRMIATL